MNTPLGRTNYLLYIQRSINSLIKQKFQGQGVFLIPLVLFIRGSKLNYHLHFPIIQLQGQSIAFTPTFSCSSQKLKILRLRGTFGAVQDPQGAVHRRLQNPLAMGLSHHTIIRVFMCFHTNFQLLITEIEDFVAQGRFWACSGPLGAVHRGPQTPLAIGLPHHSILSISKCFYTNFQLFISKFVDFMAQGVVSGL